MKLSELARYWAAKELTQITRAGEAIQFHAPFACPEFTVSIPKGARGNLLIQHDGKTQLLKEVALSKQLQSNTWCEDNDRLVACFNLPKGNTELVWQ
jgi:hypothetical protein